MGKIASSVKKKFAFYTSKKIVDISEIRETRKEVQQQQLTLSSLKEEMIIGGLDPLFQVYISSMAFFASCMYPLAETPELKEFKKISIKNEDLYMPSAPPMSPILDSYFSFWESFDMRFGVDSETLGTIFLELVDLLKISEDEIDILKNLSASRMGVYEVISIKGGKYLLREFVSDNEFWCSCPSGHIGEVGEIWYTRLLHTPKSIADLVSYSTLGTTTYVMRKSTTKADWIDFFKRQNVSKNNLDFFMKYGTESNFWNEYIFWGYSNYTGSAVFLSGIPDKTETLPCHKDFIKEEEGIFEHGNNFEFIEDDKRLDLPEEFYGKKVSQVFLEFSMPLINEFGNNVSAVDELEEALKIPWAAWNSVIMGKKLKLPKELKNNKEFGTMVKFFEKRKNTEFSQYKYLLGEFEVVPMSDGFNLKIQALAK
jgi:hypothetical protein